MRLVLPFLLLCLSASPLLAEPRLEGEYPGFIWSGGIDNPGRTALTTGPDGKISGAYAFDEMGSEVQGLLTDCALKGRILRCTWNDDYGTGALVLRFTADFWAFEGSWYDSSQEGRSPAPDKGYRWTGAKVGT